MKQTTIIITVIMLAINLLFGFLLSSFKPFNVGFSSIVILITGTLLYLLQVVRLKEAFAISLSFLFSAMGVVEYVFGILSPQHLRDNGYLIAGIVAVAFEVLFLIICSVSSKLIR